MLNEVPTWAKAIFAAFIGGFAGAALKVLETVADGAAVNYKAAFSAGLAGGLIAVLAYLKPSPAQVIEAAKKSQALLLIGALLLPIPFTAATCSTKQKASLKVVASYLVQGAIGFDNEIEALNVAGYFKDKPGKYEAAKARAIAVKQAADGIANYLNKLSEINSYNVADVISLTSEATNLFSGVLQNPGLIGLPSTSRPIRLLSVGVITLAQIAAAIRAAGPPPAGEASFTMMTVDTKPVPAKKVVVDLPEVDADLRHHFRK